MTSCAILQQNNIIAIISLFVYLQQKEKKARTEGKKYYAKPMMSRKANAGPK